MIMIKSTLQNMPEYGFSLTLIFPYKERIYPYTGKYGQKKLVF